MDKYVKLADLEKYSKYADSMGLPLEKSGKYLLKFAQTQATDEVAEVVRCKNCIRRSDHASLGNVCMKGMPDSLIQVEPDGFCSDGIPINPKV